LADAVLRRASSFGVEDQKSEEHCVETPQPSTSWMPRGRSRTTRFLNTLRAVIHLKPDVAVMEILAKEFEVVGFTRDGIGLDFSPSK
jgi:hypothetical protein